MSNEYVLILSILFAFTLFMGFRLGIKRGGWNRHLPYLFTLCIYVQYLFITPIFFYLNEKRFIIGTDISEYYGMSIFYNLIGVFCFIVGYWIMGFRAMGKWDHPPKRVLTNPNKTLTILFYCTYCVVLVNLAIGGVNIGDVFLGNEQLGLGAKGASYFFQNFSDSLITILILAYLLGIPRRKLILWLLASFFLFSLLGFRYRIILTLIGLLFVFLYRNKLKLSVVLLTVGLSLVFFYVVMFSTLNRNVLISRNYAALVYDPLKFKYENFFEQTRGSLADMAIYKLYHNSNKSVSHDYGATMFGYVFIRMIPRTIMPDKDKFYPPPQIEATIMAYDSPYGKFTGEAILSMGALYIAGGIIGLVLGNFLWGILFRRLGNSIRVRDPLSIIAYIVIALATFQWVTRGYFPQVVDHAVYLSIPIWILRRCSKKVIGEA
jgi:hypothetical protein